LRAQTDRESQTVDEERVRDTSIERESESVESERVRMHRARVRE